MADGHVDLTGRWYPNAGGRMLQFAYPLDPAALRRALNRRGEMEWRNAIRSYERRTGAHFGSVQHDSAWRWSLTGQ